MQDRNSNIPGSDYCDEGASSKTKEQAAAAIEELKGRAHDVKEQLAASGKSTVDQLDAQREPAAKTLENAARRLQESGERVSAATSRAASTTADKLQTTADYIREKKWHDSQQLRGLPQGGVELRLKLSSLAEVERWVLSWGGNAVVIRPKELVESVKRAAKRILNPGA